VAAPAAFRRTQRLKNERRSSFGRKVDCLFFKSLIQTVGVGIKRK